MSSAVQGKRRGRNTATRCAGDCLGAPERARRTVACITSCPLVKVYICAHCSVADDQDGDNETPSSLRCGKHPQRAATGLARSMPVSECSPSSQLLMSSSMSCCCRCLSHCIHTCGWLSTVSNPIALYSPSAASLSSNT